MKRAIVEGFFPEMKGRCDRTGRGTGSSNKVAIARAFADMFKQTKAKRITIIKATIMLSEVSKCDLCQHEVCQCVEVDENKGEERA
jgi:hypothetical protein